MNWNFDNSYLKLSDKLFERQNPMEVADPQMVIFNKELADGINLGFLSEFDGDLAPYFTGNKLPQDAEPIAQAYAGHQFGHFTMLGDGRAVLLGEIISPSGSRYDLQLKGSGRTPFSRRGDGRATLQSMLREYLVSEAMYHLNIPTTRSLAVVKTGEKVARQEWNEGAVLARVASSHIRVGTFEYISKYCGIDELRNFTSYTIKRHYPELLEADNSPLELIKTVMNRQVDLIIEWMRVGFIHGVMNTDNMSIAGETIDYGPCSFMNTYNPSTVFSSIDSQGRYSFENQPYIANWNLAIFASALLPLIDKDQKKAVEKAQLLLDGMKDIYMSKFYSMMCKKLGFSETNKENKILINELLRWMQAHKVDYTDMFVRLYTEDFDLKAYQDSEFDQWFKQWQKTIENQGDKEYFRGLMAQNNPIVIPRNHMVEQVLTAAAGGDLQPFNNFHDRLKSPYQGAENDAQYQQVPADFDQHYQTFCGT